MGNFIQREPKQQMDIDPTIKIVPYYCNINHIGLSKVYHELSEMLGYSSHWPLSDNERHEVEMLVLQYCIAQYDDVAALDDKWMLLLNNQLIRMKHQYYRDIKHMLPWQLADRVKRKEFEMVTMNELVRLEMLANAGELQFKGNYQAPQTL